ncbi:unnamed protein product [Linum tenue]|uniref:RNase H type-1 domain-containing protein n=1 Tax=Linum tenue TaxID=586396 RepID=A0AAV0IZS0_9ROSI|nr:unnamed protein product [Linum tenue]
MELIRESAATHPHYILISQIRQLLSRDWQVEFKHVFREGIVAADFLASLGHSLSVGEHTITTPYPTLNHLLLYDVMGIQTPRFVLNNVAIYMYKT